MVTMIGSTLLALLQTKKAQNTNWLLKPPSLLNISPASATLLISPPLFMPLCGLLPLLLSLATFCQVCFPPSLHNQHLFSLLIFQGSIPCVVWWHLLYQFWDSMDPNNQRTQSHHHSHRMLWWWSLMPCYHFKKPPSGQFPNSNLFHTLCIQNILWWTKESPQEWISEPCYWNLALCHACPCLIGAQFPHQQPLVAANCIDVLQAGAIGKLDQLPIFIHSWHLFHSKSLQQENEIFSFLPQNISFFISIATSFPHGNLIISGSSAHFHKRNCIYK